MVSCRPSITSSPDSIPPGGESVQQLPPWTVDCCKKVVPYTRSATNLASTARNIEAICALERKALERRTAAERLSDVVAFQAGRLWSILFHAGWFGMWAVWNSPWFPAGLRFDPFPFPALTTVVSLEAIFLSLFILMSENRSNRRGDERAQLDLQVNLLAEHEATKMLQLLQALCAHHQLAVAQDPELAELLRQTEPLALAHELERQLPSEGTSPRSNG